MSCHSLLAWRVSTDRSAVILMGIPLCVICCFSLAAFNICSLCFIFVNLTNMCLGVLRQVLGPGALGRPRGIGWRGRWEGGSGWGVHVNPWLIHVNVWKKPLQYCKVISLQLIKINVKNNKSKLFLSDQRVLSLQLSMQKHKISYIFVSVLRKNTKLKQTYKLKSSKSTKEIKLNLQDAFKLFKNLLKYSWYINDRYII